MFSRWNRRCVSMFVCMLVASVGRGELQIRATLNAADVCAELASVLAKKTPKVWLFAGDSITQGVVHTHGWQDYCELFRERLHEIGRSEDVVINVAVSGWRLRDLDARFDERVSRFRPDVVVLMFGTNDAAAGAEHLQAFSSHYAEAVRKSRRAGASLVVLQTTIPMVALERGRSIDADRSMNASELRNRTNRYACLEKYVAATRLVASAENVPTIDHWAVWPKSVAEQRKLMSDDLHPNEHGHRVMAGTLIRRCGLWDASSRVCRRINQSEIQ